MAIMKILVKGGLVWEGQLVVDVDIADRIAEANGHVCAERFVKVFDGKTLTLDKKYKIIEPKGGECIV